MKGRFDTELELKSAAAAAGRAWRERGVIPLTVGLRGELGAGKTTWVRALLAGLGYAARVPSPTYTLLEHYEVADVVVVHVDLYRIQTPDELEFLGLRDWLALPNHWLFVEWPDRAPAWVESCDLVLELGIAPGEARELSFEARTSQGQSALRVFSELGFN